MIHLMDLARAVAEAVAPQGYRVFAEPPREADYAAPLIFLSLLPTAEETTGGGATSDRTILVDLAYLEPGAVSRAAYYDFIAAMDRALRPTLRFCGREIMPAGIACDLVEGVGHYQMTLAFRDSLEAQGLMAEQMDVLETEVTHGTTQVGNEL